MAALLLSLLLQLGLLLHQAAVEPRLGHQLPVGPPLGNLPFLQHIDHVRIPDGGEPVGDDEQRAGLGQLADAVPNFLLAVPVWGIRSYIWGICLLSL